MADHSLTCVRRGMDACGVGRARTLRDSGSRSPPPAATSRGELCLSARHVMVGRGHPKNGLTKIYAHRIFELNRVFLTKDHSTRTLACTTLNPN
jgi:hypothetical protein